MSIAQGLSILSMCVLSSQISAQPGFRFVPSLSISRCRKLKKRLHRQDSLKILARFLKAVAGGRSMFNFIALSAVPLLESSDCGPRCQLWREALEPQTHHERRLQEGLLLARPNPSARRELRGQAKAGNSKVAQQAGNDLVLPKADPGLQDPKLWLAEARLRQHAMLCTPRSSPRCTPTNKWIKDLDPSAASLFQVGANIHQSTSCAVPF